MRGGVWHVPAAEWSPAGDGGGAGAQGCEHEVCTGQRRRGKECEAEQCARGCQWAEEAGTGRWTWTESERNRRQPYAWSETGRRLAECCEEPDEAAGKQWRVEYVDVEDEHSSCWEEASDRDHGTQVSTEPCSSKYYGRIRQESVCTTRLRHQRTFTAVTTFIGSWCEHSIARCTRKNTVEPLCAA